MTRYASTLAQSEFSPLTQFYHSLLSTTSTTSSILHSQHRPTNLIRSINTAKDTLAKHQASASRSQRWPSAFGLLDETRSAHEKESMEKANEVQEEIKRLGSELRYTQQTVAVELAGWQEGHGAVIKSAVRDLARRMVVVEKERLEGMRRCLRRLREDTAQP